MKPETVNEIGEKLCASCEAAFAAGDDDASKAHAADAAAHLLDLLLGGLANLARLREIAEQGQS